MPTNTQNLNLEKRTEDEQYDVDVVNLNLDKIDTAVGNKVDKVAGKGLSANDYTTTEKNKLVGIEISANNYAHPASHLPSIIVQDVNNRFVTDAEKTTWNGKQPTLVSGTNIKTINGNSVLGSGDIPTMLPKNWIINGMFDVWQRGTSQTLSGYGSDDRWQNEHNGSTKTNSRQAFVIGQTDVPNNPTYFNRTIVTSVVGISNFVKKTQAIEDVTKLAGKAITVSFWAKADTNKSVSIEFAQYFGSGGSTFLTSLNVQKFALTTTWQRFTKTITLPSVSGKTIGVGNCTVLYLWFDAGTNYNTQTNSLGHQSGTFDIANVSLVEGSVAVECQNQPYADVLWECKLYCYKHTTNHLPSHAHQISTSEWLSKVQFPREMRVKPTITMIDPASGWSYIEAFLNGVYIIQNAQIKSFIASAEL